MNDQAEKGKITFNGVNGATGGYLTAPMTAEELVEWVNKALWGQDHLDELKNRHFGAEASIKVPPEYGGWQRGETGCLRHHFPCGCRPGAGGQDTGGEGRADRAASWARAAVIGKADWWSPVLYTRLKGGQIWR